MRTGRNYRVNCSKIEKRVGFRCRYTLEDGVREIKNGVRFKTRSAITGTFALATLGFFARNGDTREQERIR